jgi:hypothetical protein
VFGENLPIPEIVAIGGQSDGKSSLLEAFLGVTCTPVDATWTYPIKWACVVAVSLQCAGG